jgi:hypothetical protein
MLQWEFKSEYKKWLPLPPGKNPFAVKEINNNFLGSGVV